MERFRRVKRMIRGIGAEMASTYSQTLNRRVPPSRLSGRKADRIRNAVALGGPFLVSRTGDAG